jgi:hypothetical protein
VQANILSDVVLQTNLRTADVGHNGMAGSLDSVAAALSNNSNASKLTDLRAPGNSLTGSIPPELAKLGVFTAPSIVDVDGLVIVSRLDFSANNLTGPVPEELYSSGPETAALVRVFVASLKAYLGF